MTVESHDRDRLISHLKEHPISVGSDGSVRLVDVMGDDSSIVQAARISYGAGTKDVSTDVALLRYLMRNRHTTPFEMAVVKLHVRIPMDAWRQGIRHRTASVNEYSTRYSEAIDEMAETADNDWRVQSAANKQGSSGTVEEFPEGYTVGCGKLGFRVFSPGAESESDLDSGVCFTVDDYPDPGHITAGDYLTRREREFHRRAKELYLERLDFGVAREQARKDLPLSNYTEAYWQFNLHNLLHMLGLRMDSHAQLEIREYAEAIGNQIVAPLFPETWNAFRDYRLEAMSLSRMEVNALRHMIQCLRNEVNCTVDPNLDATALDFQPEWLPASWCGERSRERDEFQAKLVRMGLPEDCLKGVVYRASSH